MSVAEFQKLGEAAGLTGQNLLQFVEEKLREEKDREKEEKDRERDERHEAREKDKEIEMERLRQEREAKEKENEAKEKFEMERLRQESEARDKIEMEKLKQYKEIEIEKLKQEKEIEMERIKLEGARPKTPKHEDSRTSYKPHKLPNFNPVSDNIDSYLHRFELYCKSCKMPEDMYVSALSALLTGPALDVFRSLASAGTLSYTDLKNALLVRFDCTEQGFRKQFRRARPQPDEGFPAFAARLNSYLSRWLELAKVSVACETCENSKSLLDLFLREQFLNSLHRDIETYLREKALTSFDELVKAAEAYRQAHPSKPMAASSSSSTPSSWNVSSAGAAVQNMENRKKLCQCPL